MKFEWDPDYVPGVKLGLHSFQIIFAIIAWILEIVVFRNDKAKITGRNGWTFAVVSFFEPWNWSAWLDC